MIAIIALTVFLHFTEQGATVGSYEVRVLNLCAVYAVLALSMNLINGFTGQFSLGTAGFMAIGAYTTSLLIMPVSVKAKVFYLEPIVPWLENVHWEGNFGLFGALLVAGLITAVAAFIIGFPVLRLKGDYLAIATLGFSEIIRIVFTNTQSVTNGSTGIKSIPNTANIWWTFGVMAFFVVFMLRLMKTSYGRAFKCIRDDEVAAESMGISLFKHKMLSFVISGFMAGVGGGLMASVLGAITPLLFRFILAYDILLIVVLGGMGSITGSIVGAFLITTAKEWLRWLDAGFNIGPIKVPQIAGLRMVVFSALLMLVILFYRRGLFGNKEFSWDGMFRLIKNAPKRVAAWFKPKPKGGGAK
ncbi:branched-chain amino acid ABC transporter permease [Eubacteriales bacterium OttesenSCG-928-K08]|nr:branched-chain amino acid ABC transporter permease [Eubacteriales bacterium OttesenSCG-928-K08]